MSYKRKIYLSFSMLFAIACLAGAALSKTSDHQAVSHLPLTQLPDSDPSKTGSHYNRGYTFSHDSRLFVLLQSGREVADSQFVGSTLRIWDTQTGELKYQTIIPRHQDSYPLRPIPLAFSPDNKLVFRSGGRQADMFIWPFTQSDKVELICLLGNLNDNQRVTGISKDRQHFLVSGVEYESVCQFNGNKLNYQKINTQRLWGINTKILHNNRLLVIHNIRSTKSPITDEGHSLEKEALDYIDFWDINFSSDANHLLKVADQKNERFFIIEVFEKQITINQWDYADRKFISKQSFKNIQIKAKHKEQLNTYLSDSYLLIQSEQNLTLFQRDGDRLSQRWHENIPTPTEVDPWFIKFSLDERYIVLGDLSFANSERVTLISTQTGQILSYYDGKRSEGSIIITEPLVNSFPNQPLDGKCPDTAKSLLHSLVSDISQEVDGHVLAMSPDGKVLAVCKSNELSLLRLRN